jgi:hypothetical protein
MEEGTRHLGGGRSPTKDPNDFQAASPGSFASLKDDGRRNGEGDEETERSFYSAAPSSLDRKNRSDRQNSRGSVLIEFAICVPVLIMCLVAMHDIPKYYQIQAKLTFAAHCCVNMLQDVSVNRANKKITKSDVQRIAHAWTLIPWSNPNIVYQNSAGKLPLNFFANIFLFYVVGTGDNKCKVMWSLYSSTNTKTIPTLNWNSNTSGALTAGWASSLRLKGNLQTNINSTKLLPNFHIKNEEKKVIVEIVLYSYNPPSHFRRGFGFWMLSPKPSVTPPSSKERGFFTTFVIFTPKPGLFTETPPQ